MGLHERFSGLNCSEPEKVTYFTEGLKSSLKVKVLERMPETLLEAEELARTFNSISRRLEDNEPESLEKLLSKSLAQKQELSSHVFPEKPPAWVEALIGKLPASTTPAKTTVAALNESRDKREDLSQQLQDELRQLKDLLSDKIDSQDILMLVYEVWLDKIKASMMRYHVKGQKKDSHAVLPVDELVILQSTAPNAEAQAQSHFLRDHIPPRRSNYQPYSSYNQPRDNYRNSPQQHRRDLNLAALDEHSSNEDFIAELERNTSSQVSNDLQEPFHKNGKIMQNASVNIICSEAVMLSKQKSRNSENLHRRLTPRPPPLSGKRNQTCQYMKPTAKRETQPHLGHALGPARTQENNVENIREEIKSYVASALHLFEQLPSGPKTTGPPGTQPNEAQSSRVVVPHCTTPRLPRSPTESTTLSVHNRDKLPSFSAKHFEEIPSDVEQSLFHDPSKFTINGRDSSPRPQQVIGYRIMTTLRSSLLH